jgi:hypothetical protein
VEGVIYRPYIQQKPVAEHLRSSARQVFPLRPDQVIPSFATPYRFIFRPAESNDGYQNLIYINELILIG